MSSRASTQSGSGAGSPRLRLLRAARPPLTAPRWISSSRRRSPTAAARCGCSARRAPASRRPSSRPSSTGSSAASSARTRSSCSLPPGSPRPRCASGSPAGSTAPPANPSPARRPRSPSASCAGRPRPRGCPRRGCCPGRSRTSCCASCSPVTPRALAGRRTGPTRCGPALRTRGFRTELRDLMMRAVERGLGPGRPGRAGPRARPAGVGGRCRRCSRSTTRSPRSAAPAPTTRR